METIGIPLELTFPDGFMLRQVGPCAGLGMPHLGKEDRLGKGEEGEPFLS